MKAIILEGFGGTEQLKVEQISTPTPGPNEVQIHIVYTAVNPVDWKIREGLLKSRIPHEFPLIPGWDAAGIISAVGENVTKFKIGDEVFAYCRQAKIKWGTYAEYICILADLVAFKPKNISFAQAAAIPLAGLTAWQSLFDAAQLKKGETVLIHAGAGGVGSLAIQFAKNIGARVYTTATQPKHDYVKGLGANVAIDYQQENFVDKIKSLESTGVDVVFDTVGKQTLKDSFKAIKPGGRLVSIVEPPDEILAEQYKSKAIYVFVAPNGQELQQISDLISLGKVKPIQIEEMPLEQAGEAQEKNRQGRTKGKIVLKIS
jgi:NADPH:quinone reductase-like Zn-dependent oxidoreductase